MTLNGGCCKPLVLLPPGGQTTNTTFILSLSKAGGVTHNVFLTLHTTIEERLTFGEPFHDLCISEALPGFPVDMWCDRMAAEGCSVSCLSPLGPC